MIAAVSHDVGVLALGVVVVLGVGLQLLANALRLPAIVLLLLGGVLAGPVSGIIEPDELLGGLLYPAVSLAVGLVLFEGGLGLRFSELEHHGRGPIVRLVTVGVLVTWLIGGLGAYWIVGLDGGSAALLGAILVVSGPTVVLPLLRFARPREPVNGILRWEGIVIDPVGATLAIVVLGAVIDYRGARLSVQRIFTTAGTGTILGLAGAAILILLFRKHLVPDNLHNPFTLAVAVAAFAGADLVRPEAGLFAATVMGIVLANQTTVPVGHIREFEESLGTLILGALFIVLGANIDLDAVAEYLPEALVLSVVLLGVARPVAVWSSTAGSGLRFGERAYLMCVSPRGIVAASVSSLFALELEEAGEPVEALAPVTFVVIVVSVVVSAVASVVGARQFRVARPPPRGVAFIGGPPWALELAAQLADHDVPTVVVSSDPSEIDAASSLGLLTYAGPLASEDFVLALEGVGVSAALAVARFEEFNVLGINRAVPVVGRANVYYLPRSEEDLVSSESSHAAVIARRAFGSDCTRTHLDDVMAAGGHVVAVTAETHDPDALAGAVPLLAVRAQGAVALAGSLDGKPEAGVTHLYLRRAPTKEVGALPAAE